MLTSLTCAYFVFHFGDTFLTYFTEKCFRSATARRVLMGTLVKNASSQSDSADSCKLRFKCFDVTVYEMVYEQNPWETDDCGHGRLHKRRERREIYAVDPDLTQMAERR